MIIPFLFSSIVGRSCSLVMVEVDVSGIWCVWLPFSYFFLLCFFSSANWWGHHRQMNAQIQCHGLTIIHPLLSHRSALHRILASFTYSHNHLSSAHLIRPAQLSISINVHKPSSVAARPSVYTKSSPYFLIRQLGHRG